MGNINKSDFSVVLGNITFKMALFPAPQSSLTQTLHFTPLGKARVFSNNQVETNHRNQGQTSAPRHAKISLMLTIPG